MITGDDIRRLEEEEAKKKKKLVIIDTMQFFEIEIPEDVDADAFVNSDLCRQVCADKILGGTTDLSIDRVLTNFNPTTKEWT
ncbi:hypothetical protein PP753_gp17 [Dinoroseobacter phage vB_DshP-R7L]|uniref:Uncharacterized protein n=1 Tax=Dinoroseobacter phage vB_DshP-R7L TaxID=2873349 RepID=A0AAE8XC04_9CAUD|nr:hypothetical protein PP753_gp17 [Dinoroseobacter phage vB_DshP-R7L]UAT28856.1 hypothetical protein R7L_gp17 [Dinoroseobacter phage vB_DshP-R7L]